MHRVVQQSQRLRIGCRVASLLLVKTLAARWCPAESTYPALPAAVLDLQPLARKGTLIKDGDVDLVGHGATRVNYGSHLSLRLGIRCTQWILQQSQGTHAPVAFQ